ncbi:MAG: 3'-5' exonuclease [Nanoarchaeota archaeon]
MSKRKIKRDVVLVIDFEATCWNHTPPEGMQSEIIEIGISGVNYNTKEIVLNETIIVKPETSTVSPFCTELTTITQEFVDANGVSLEEACKILEKKYNSKERIWMSWGEYDRKIIENNCQLKNIKNPFGRTHINLKPLFSFAFGINTDLGVGQALEHLGMDFEGTPHRGGDDAYNIARILKKTFVPLMEHEKYGEKKKKDHEKLEEYLNDKYSKEQLNENVARVVNKTTPQNPDKTNR